MMSRLYALIPVKFRAQMAAESRSPKYAPMTMLRAGQLRDITGGDNSDSPKGSWQPA